MYLQFYFAIFLILPVHTCTYIETFRKFFFAPGLFSLSWGDVQDKSWPYSATDWPRSGSCGFGILADLLFRISSTSRWKHVTSAQDWLVRMLKESCQPDAVAWLKGGVFPLVFMFQAAVKMKFLSSSCGDFALRAAVAIGEDVQVTHAILQGDDPETGLGTWTLEQAPHDRIASDICCLFKFAFEMQLDKNVEKPLEGGFEVLKFGKRQCR